MRYQDENNPVKGTTTDTDFLFLHLFYCSKEIVLIKKLTYVSFLVLIDNLISCNVMQHFREVPRNASKPAVPRREPCTGPHIHRADVPLLSHSQVLPGLLIKFPLNFKIYLVTFHLCQTFCFLIKAPQCSK